MSPSDENAAAEGSANQTAEADPSSNDSAPANPDCAARVAPVRPTARFMLAHPAHLIAFGFGSGLSPVAPGTIGTLWAWLAWLVLALWLSPVQQLVLVIASLPLGWWACTVTSHHLKVADSGHIVWDEVTAFWLILLLILPAGFWAQLTAFALFRLFDAVKRGPVGWADRTFHGFGARGGFGIMFDDLVAAFCTLLVYALTLAVLTRQ